MNSESNSVSYHIRVVLALLSCYYLIFGGRLAGFDNSALLGRGTRHAEGNNIYQCKRLFHFLV
jgi:hypothetical protein